MSRATKGRGDNAAAGVEDVEGPQPGHVVGAVGAEQGGDVPPGGHEYGRAVVPVTPRAPPPVHLVAKAQDDRPTANTRVPRVGARVRVVLRGRSRGQADVVGSIYTSDTAPCRPTAAKATWNGSGLALWYTTTPGLIPVAVLSAVSPAWERGYPGRVNPEVGREAAWIGGRPGGRRGLPVGGPVMHAR
jgi:hypothetical protein